MKIRSKTAILYTTSSGDTFPTSDEAAAAERRDHLRKLIEKHTVYAYDQISPEEILDALLKHSDEFVEALTGVIEIVPVGGDGE